MIYCPKCGTANRDGSKFCNECGETLSATRQVQCAVCGAVNEPENTYCVQCGSRVVGAEEPPAAEEAPATGVPTELPAWLADLRQGGRESQEPAEEAVIPAPPAPSVALSPTPELQQIPTDFLGKLRRAAAAAAAESEQPAEEQEAAASTSPVPPFRLDAEDDNTLPQWLTQLRQQAVERPGATAALIEEQTRPLPPAAEAEAEAPVAAAEVSPAEEPIACPPGLAETAETLPPAWLAGMVPAAAPTEEMVIPVTSEPVAAAVAEEAPPSAFVEEPTPAPLEPAAVPDWLRELGPLPQAEESISAEPAAPLPAEIPDWLRESFGEPAAAAPATPALPALPAINEAGLAQAEIPAWLQALRPGTGPRPTEGAPTLEGEAGTSGVLAGLSHIIPIELAVAKPPETTLVGSMLTAIPAESEGGKAFAQLLQPVAPAPAAPALRRSWAPLWRLVLGLLLILAISIPLVTGWSPFTAGAPAGGLRPEAEAVLGQIEALEPGSAVLLAFDFDASTVDEMGPLAQTLVAHLLSKNVRVIAVSLLPGGPAVASRLLAASAADAPTKPYINLGYLAGKEAALRSFRADPFGQARDFDTGEPAAGSSLLQGLGGLNDFALIVELASAQDTARWWIEQVRVQSTVPMVGAVSAAIEPYLLPYTSGAAAPLAGLLAGVADASLYQQQIGAGGAPALGGQAEALSWAAAVGLLVILAGLLIGPLLDRERGK